MKTPLARGLLIFGVVAFMAVIAVNVGDVKPNARFDVSQPDRAPIAAHQWFFVVATEQLEMNSQNFSQQLQALERLFTVEGYRDFIILLQQTGAIHNLQSNDVTFDLELITSPIGRAHGLKDDRYTWIMDSQVSFNIAFETNNISVPVNLRVLVSRSLDEDSLDGLKIRQLIVLTEDPVSN